MIRKREKTLIVFDVFFLTVVLLGSLTLRIYAYDNNNDLLQNQWRRIYLQGQRVGYANIRTQKIKEGGQTTFITKSKQFFKIARAGVEMEFEIRQQIKELEDGKVTHFQQIIQQGPISQRVVGEVKNDMMVVVSGEGENAVRQEFDPPEGLGPWAVERYAMEQGFDEDTDYSLDVFVIDAPSTPAKAHVSIGTTEKVQLYDVKKMLRKVVTKYDIMPNVTSTMWIDDNGTAWITQAGMGPFNLEMRKAPEYAARRPIEEPGVALDIAVKPNRMIYNAPELEYFKCHILPSASGYSLPKPPDGVNQTVEKFNGGFTVEIARHIFDPDKSYYLPYEGERFTHLLQESPWLEINAPIIKELTDAALEGEPDSYRAARRIERFVHDSIEDKGLDLGFATAVETAHQMSGDCTEHSVLAIALARAAGIPARAVVGLSYGGPLPGDTVPKFYYHMWAEFWVGEWLPVDAALGSHNVTNIVIARSDLSDPEAMLDLTNTAMAIMGRIAIDVIECR